MDLESFKNSLNEKNPPADINEGLKALWFDAKGNWEKAHNIAQEMDNKAGSLIHAYLHRKEGDKSNARYWYSLAREKYPDISLEHEWDRIASNLLKD